MTIGDNCKLGVGEEVPNTWKPHIYSEGLVTIGEDSVVPHGVTIGKNSVIGAGSVVTKDIPENVVAVGNPCRVMRPIGEKDRETFFRDEKIDWEELNG